MKPKHEIEKLIEKHRELYDYAEKYIHTCGLKVHDIFRVNDELMVTCENISKQPVYLKVENQELFKKIGSITKDWQHVFNQTF